MKKKWIIAGVGVVLVVLVALFVRPFSGSGKKSGSLYVLGEGTYGTECSGFYWVMSHIDDVRWGSGLCFGIVRRTSFRPDKTKEQILDLVHGKATP